MLKNIRWRNLERDSLRYALLKIFVRFWHNHFYYRRVITLHQDRIPSGDPVIFAPNHINAAMDGLAILCTTPGQPIFLARSDIFRKRFYASLLTFLKIMPIYRIRDGISSLPNNDMIFRKTVEILKRGRPLVILPEGNHADKKRLRPIKKGISRIAFQAEEAAGYQLRLKIVPVGLDYLDIRRFRSGLLVNFGEPITVSDYFDTYRENPQKGMNALRDELASRIRNLMVHIHTDTHYEGYIGILDLYHRKMVKRMKGKYHTWHHLKFESDRRLVEILDMNMERDPERVKEICKKSSDYQKLRDQLGLRDRLFEKGRIRTGDLVLQALSLFIASPIFLAGFLANFIPFRIPAILAGKFQDDVFLSTVKYVGTLVLFPLYYILMFALFWALSGSLLISLGILAGFALSGILAYGLWLSWNNFLGKWRYRKLCQSKKAAFMRALSLRLQIISMMDELLERTEKMIAA